MDFVGSLVAPLTTLDGWMQIVVLMFLELALGVDNLVFIAITSDRLPQDKQHIGRRLGLSAAMVMRCVLLCCVVWIMSINIVVFTLPFGVVDGTTPFDVRGLVFLLGGAYLVYKGIAELRETHASASSEGAGQTASRERIGLAHAVGVIMVMDIVFSLDSVITAAGLSGQILIMIIAVIGAVLIMIAFADQISDFINRNPEVKTVALAFITLVGVELLLESFHVEQIAGAPLSTLLYAMMLFGFATAVLIMVQRNARERSAEEHGRVLEPSGADSADDEEGDV